MQFAKLIFMKIAERLHVLTKIVQFEFGKKKNNKIKVHCHSFRNLSKINV